MAFVAAFDHADVELVRQGEHRQHAEQHQRDEAAVIGRGRGLGQRLRRRQPESQPDEQAQREHRHQLEQRFERHRQHQPAIVLGSAGTARAEQHREDAHHQRHVQRAVAPGRLVGTGLRVGQQRKAHRHRLQLQGDVRDQAEHRDQGHARSEPCILAQAGSDQVGDGGGVAGPCQLHQLQHQPRAERVQQQRADEGRRQRPVVACGLGDCAEEGPRSAVDRQRQRVDVVPVAGQHARAPFGIQRSAEQQAQPQHRGRDDHRDAQHRAAFRHRIRGERSWAGMRGEDNATAGQGPPSWLQRLARVDQKSYFTVRLYWRGGP